VLGDFKIKSTAKIVWLEESLLLIFYKSKKFLGYDDLTFHDKKVSPFRQTR
jgi:hypothetical protein